MTNMNGSYRCMVRFIQQIFNKHLLFVRKCSRCWWHISINRLRNFPLWIVKSIGERQNVSKYVSITNSTPNGISTLEETKAGNEECWGESGVQLKTKDSDKAPFSAWHVGRYRKVDEVTVPTRRVSPSGPWVPPQSFLPIVPEDCLPSPQCCCLIFLRLSRPPASSAASSHSLCSPAHQGLQTLLSRPQLMPQHTRTQTRTSQASLRTLLHTTCSV